MNELSLYSFVTAGLCLVAYLLGIRRRRTEAANLSIQAVRRAHELAKALEDVVQSLRDAVYKHQKQVAAFQRQIESKTPLELKDVEQVVQSSHELVSDLVFSQGRISEQLGRLKELTQSRTDHLTGVSNRRSFEEELNLLLTRYKETDEGFSMTLVDIDRFKAINDTLGHPMGDQVLKHVVGLMASHIRQTDSLSRIGGEEFAILMPRNDRAGSLRVMERIREAIEASMLQVGNRKVQVTISAGIVIAMPGELADSLIRRADAVLYRAKQNGRNQTCIDESPLSPPGTGNSAEVATNGHTPACCQAEAK